MVLQDDKAYGLLVECNENISRMVRKSNELKDPSIYDSIRQSIGAIATNAFPGKIIRIHLFGSRIMGVGTDESDLDVFVEIGNGFHSAFASTSDHSLHDRHYKMLADKLESTGAWIINKELFNTTVPIIIGDFKLRPRHILPRMNCDISITNGISVRNTQLIAKMFELQPKSVEILHFIRTWIKSFGIGYLKNYTITLMFVFFLQSKKYMPACKELQQGVPKEMIDGYEVQINQNYIGSPDKAINFHCAEFFRFYREQTNNSKYIMSTSDGKCHLTKNYKKMYPEFALDGILIAGPLKRGYNCGVIKPEQKKRFSKLCKVTAKLLEINKF